ncbi:MAG: leucyl/phenylalanyl-tRNA--protein transferase [Aeromicrobium sp.]
MTRVPLPPSPWAFDPDRWPDDDCVAVGADLEPGTILEAYRCGAFPMPHDGDLLWWSPMRRGVLVPADIRVSRSLARSVRRFMVTVDESFADVVDACADPSRPGSWIDADIRDAYVHLHELGWAHSIETRTSDGTLVGGLYGLSIGALFAGESMFHHATDASKVALVELARRVGGGLIDTQWSTPHLASLGVTEWSREVYLDRIAPLVDASPPAGWD